jgi:hypothetical protein
MTLDGHGVGTFYAILDLNMPVSGADGIWLTAQVFKIKHVLRLI